MLFHGVYVLLKKPFVIAIWGDDAWDTVLKAEQKPSILLWHCAWNQATLKRMLKLKYRFFQAAQLGIKPLLVTNTKDEERYRKLLGIPGFKSSAYVFVDENDYQPMPLEKKYKAVYAAQLKSFKRIPLSKCIDPLFIITYKSGQTNWNLHAEFPEMKHAHFNNKWIDPLEKNSLLNESAVGLCLSEEEGPMLASLEYMLNGLPVVSTPSKGGRDEYYEDAYCRIVSPDPIEVSKAVEELIKLKLDPEFIRNRALQKLSEDRKIYADSVSKLIKKYLGYAFAPEQLMKDWFSEPKSKYVKLSEYSGSHSNYTNTCGTS